MKYKNTKTGVIISSSCKINGGDWILLENIEPKEVKNVEEAKIVEKEIVKEVEEVVNDEAIDNVTKKQIMQELDSMGIKYDKNDRKEVLYNLMIGE